MVAEGVSSLMFAVAIWSPSVKGDRIELRPCFGRVYILKCAPDLQNRQCGTRACRPERN